MALCRRVQGDERNMEAAAGTEAKQEAGGARRVAGGGSLKPAVTPSLQSPKHA